MLVHPVAIPGPGMLSWTVLGDDDVPVVPVDRFLAYLTDIGRSPNTVKAYAHDLKDYWDFIGFRDLDWQEALLEDVGEFVAWLQLPPAGRAGEVAVLPSAVAQATAATVNRKLAAVSAFYAHQARNGAEVGDLLAAWRTAGRGGWKPFLHHVSKGKPYRGRAISLKVPQKLPRILTAAETQAILDACIRLRDRFFFALLHESGCRAGEALGLRHEDIAAAEREISIVSRENANGARAKSGGRTVPAGGPVTFAAVASAARIPRSWLYTQPDTSDQIRRLRGKQTAPAPPAPFLPASGPPTRPCAPGSPPPSPGTSGSPTRTPSSAASSPAHSANSGPPGPDQVTIRTREDRPSGRARPSKTLSTTGRRRSQPRLTPGSR